MSSWTVRPAEDSDLPAASELLERCGWHDPVRLRTLAYLLESGSGSIHVADTGGGLIGVVGAMSFGETAWSTSTAVDPDTRYSGVATSLLVASEDWMDARGVRTVFAFITPAARRICEVWGSVDEGEITLGWLPPLDPADARNGSQTEGLRPLRAEDLHQVLTLDRKATGEDRSAFLSVAFGHGGMAVDGDDGALAGFDLYSRWGPGPIVARTPEVGLALIEERRRRWSGPRAIIIPVANQAACAGLPEAKWQMRLTRIRRGPHVPRRPDMLFGHCNFYWG